MAIDPQVATPMAVILALIAILGQVVSYFIKPQKKEHDDGNGNKNQVRINTENIADLIRDVRKDNQRLGTIEEKVKNNELEILNMRPRLHQMGNDLSRLNFAEDERRRKRT